MQLEVNIARKAFTNAAGERHDVLVDFNFALGAGEVGVFVGPSGCGKSTLLKILVGLDHDYSGRVVRPADARIGMVFQEPRLLPWRSVEENVRLAAPQADDARLSMLFAVLELNAHRNHFPGELSLGLARRVALARAFAVEPDLLILDEPAAGLAHPDVLQQIDIIRRVHQRGITIILIEHHMDVVSELCNIVTVLDGGRIIAEGTPDKVKRHPKVVEAYLGQPVQPELPGGAEPLPA